MLGQWCVDVPPDGLGAGEGDAAKTGDASSSATVVTAATASVDKTATMPHGCFRCGGGTTASGAAGSTLGTFSSDMGQMLDPDAQNRL
jgi:hypothetical protein